MLYTMAKVYHKTGKRVVLYAHITANVVTEYWEAYMHKDYILEIKPFQPENNDCICHTGGN